ncbi:MAG: DedA family protein [Patescibacteria group bacterium]
MLFPIVVVEGPVVTVIAGFLSSLGHLSLFIAYWVIVAGDIAGDSIYYAVGRWGREGFIERWGHYVGITVERVRRLEKYFTQHSGKTLMIGKITHAIGAVILIAAGVARVPFRRFVLFNFIPTLPKSLVFILIGYYFGQVYVKFDRYLEYATVAVIGLIILSAGIYFIIRKLGKRYEQ